MTAQQRLQVGAAQPWLPSSAFESDLWQEALASAVAAWSTVWFGEASLKMFGPLRPWNGQAGDWRTCGEGLAVGAGLDQQVSPAGHLLGFNSSDWAKFNSADRKLAGDLALRCARGLGDAIAVAAGLDRSERWPTATDADLSAMLCAGVGPRPGDMWLRVAMDRALLVRLLREAAPDGRSATAICAIEDAIEAQPVGVSALVGRCQVSLGDLTSLVPGDILCLDADTHAPVALAIEHAASTATCRIEQDGGALRLRISQ